MIGHVLVVANGLDGEAHHLSRLPFVKRRARLGHPVPEQGTGVIQNYQVEQPAWRTAPQAAQQPADGPVPPLRIIAFQQDAQINITVTARSP